MKFAKIVFRVAAIWGVLIITPLYFMFALIGRNDPPAITHPGFFYGFVGTALAWQIAFFFIASDPVRYRPLMIPSTFEKFSYGAAVVVLSPASTDAQLGPALCRHGLAARCFVRHRLPQDAASCLLRLGLRLLRINCQRLRQIEAKMNTAIESGM